MELLSSNKLDNITDLLNTLELSYTNNHLLDTLEKKYNKLINIELVPFVNVILCQYYLVILGGDYQNNGLVNDLKVYICKLKSNLATLESMTNKPLDKQSKIRMEKLIKIIHENESKSSNLYKNMLESYHQHLEISITDETCKKFNLNNLHKLQLITNYNCKHQIDSPEHINNLSTELEKLNEFSNDSDEEDIILKFIDSQISVIEQQLDFFKA